MYAGVGADVGVDMDVSVSVCQCGCGSSDVGVGVRSGLGVNHIGDDLLRLSVQVRVTQSDVVVADDAVAKGRQTLFHTPELDRVCRSGKEVCVGEVACCSAARARNIL